MTVTATPAVPPTTLTLERPDDMSDDRWGAIQNQVHEVVTGHAYWCEDHRGTEDGEEGWCTLTLSCFCADVELSTGTTTGGVMVALYPHGDVREDELNVSQAAAIGATLEEAAAMARCGNISGDPK